MRERGPSPVIMELIAWRKRNGLSQSKTVRVLLQCGYPVTLSTLHKWETGERRPGRLAEHALVLFLQKHPKVCPPE